MLVLMVRHHHNSPLREVEFRGLNENQYEIIHTMLKYHMQLQSEQCPANAA